MMDKKGQTTVVKQPNGDVTHMKGGSPSVITFKADAIAPGVGVPGTKATKQKDKDGYGGTKPWSPWGDGDDFPQELLNKVGMLGVAETGIDQNADLHYGAGIRWFREQVTKDNKLELVPVIVPEWDEFVKKTNYLVTHSEILQSLETFYIAWPEIILTKKGDDVHSVQCLETPNCRLKKKDEKSGKITHMYFVHDIETAQKDFAPIPLFDPSDPFGNKKFAVTLKYRCFGMPYYAKPNYYSTFLNGWADIAISVPQLIKSIYQNQASLKYHIKIPLSALRAEFSEYDSKEEAEKLEIQMNKKKQIDDAITGAEKSGISVLSIFDDEADRNPITIEPIKDFLESSKELPNNSAANSEILFSMNVDPSLLGLGIPGGKNLSGSGSDKRESRSNKQKNLKREREISLQLPRLLARLIKGFPQNVFPMYIDDDTSQTLDENPTGSQKIVT